MYVLGIESTCDDMGVGVALNGHQILSNVIFSQASLHASFGGVYPELASRSHVNLFCPAIKQSLEEGGVLLEQIDAIAAAQGPGLIGSLLVGMHAAKTLAWSLNRPFVGVNHIEAHLYATMISHDSFDFPSLGVVVSGGHSLILFMESPGQYQLIGRSVDDAIGESFDKVAQLLDLPYPGGPAIESLALQGNAQAFPFKIGVVKNCPYDLSFSGLKTAVLYTLQGLTEKYGRALPVEVKADLAASFQECACRSVLKKIEVVIKSYAVKKIYIGGGVSCNRYLQSIFHQSLDNVYFPKRDLSTDNGAMIAALGYWYLNKKGASSYTLRANPQEYSFFRS